MGKKNRLRHDTAYDPPEKKAAIRRDNAIADRSEAAAKRDKAVAKREEAQTALIAAVTRRIERGDLDDAAIGALAEALKGRR